jgi:translation initiation factor IF-2
LQKMEKNKFSTTIKKQPVVTILGHIDHGKTTLLNAIRNLPFTGEKPGGVITQEIGLFEVEVEGSKITFLDTPGHEIFSQMRERGAKVADIAILVVSAIEGPKDQTKEALEAIKKAQIPFLVAITKVDLPGANAQRVKQELMKIGVTVEEFGGDIPAIETSAKTGQGIKELLEILILLAEMQNLKAEITKNPKGVIVESQFDPKKGILATCLVEEGVLKVGQVIGTKTAFGKIRRMENWKREVLQEALPGQGVLVFGFEEQPGVGEIFEVFESIEKAKENLEKIEKRERKILVPEEGQKTFDIILKADCLGSLEALERLIERFPQDKVLVRVLKSEVGLVSEDDIKLAKTSGGKILAFKTGIDKVAKKILEKERQIKVYQFSVIYDLLEWIKKGIERLLEPEIERKEIGKLEVLVLFWRSGSRQIVGGKMIEGEVKRGAKIEILRGEEIVGKGKVINLQINKRDVEKAKKGDEVGILYEGDERIKEGDILIFVVEEKKKVEI